MNQDKKEDEHNGKNIHQGKVSKEKDAAVAEEVNAKNAEGVESVAPDVGFFAGVLEGWSQYGSVLSLAVSLSVLVLVLIVASGQTTKINKENEVAEAHATEEKKMLEDMASKINEVSSSIQMLESDKTLTEDEKRRFAALEGLSLVVGELIDDVSTLQEKEGVHPTIRSTFMVAEKKKMEKIVEASKDKPAVPTPPLSPDMQMLKDAITSFNESYKSRYALKGANADKSAD